MSPYTIMALFDELEKIAVSRGGWGAKRGGFRTEYTSYGVKTPNEVRSVLPKLKGTKGVTAGVKIRKNPPLKASKTNLAALHRRGRLSNIELPKG